MEKQFQLSVGSVIGWEGKKFKVVIDDEYDWCYNCALARVCEVSGLPFICDSCHRMDGNHVHFEEIGGTK